MNKIFIVSSTSITINTFLKDHILNLLDKNICYVISNYSEKLEFEHKNLYIKNIKFSRKADFLNDIKCFFQFLFFSLKHKPKLYLSITPKVGLIVSLLNTLTFSNKHIHLFTGQHWTNYNFFKKLIYKLIDQFILIMSIKSLVDGLSQFHYLKSQMWIGKKKLNVIGRGSIKGIDNKKFFKTGKYDKYIQNITNFDNSLKVILYMGRINYEKGVICLSKAVLSLINSGEKIALLLIGSVEDDSITVIKKIFSKNNSHLVILDHTKETEKFYNYSYITCLPSTREGFGMTLIESSACGTPVVGSDIYGLKDSFEDGMSGFSFKVDDINDLALKIKMLLNDKQKYNNFRDYGINRSNELFNKEKIEIEFKKFISNCL